MSTAFIVIAVTCLIAFVLVNLIFRDWFEGTIIPAIISVIIGLLWGSIGIIAIYKSNGSTGVPALVMALVMLVRAFAEFMTFLDIRDFYARWGRR